jgi:dihydrofolate reductase
MFVTIWKFEVKAEHEDSRRAPTRKQSMNQVTYYLAVSLDGYLAREDGRVDWLDPFHHPLDTPYDYQPFYQSVSALIMGRKTFESVLSFGDYCYPGKPALVFSRRDNLKVEQPEVTLVQEDLGSAVRALRETTKRRIWLVGGGEIASQLAEKMLLDEIVLTVIPVTLGSGIPWLPRHRLENSWELCEHYVAKNSVVQLIYRRKDVSHIQNVGRTATDAL